MDFKTLDITKFGGFDVYNEYSDSLKLATLWRDTIAVLVFIRHFG